MRLVERPSIRPHRCAANPSIGQTRTGFRWIDTGQDIDERMPSRVYLSEPSIRDAAKLLGFPSQGEYAQLRDERDALAFELAKAKELLAEAHQTLTAISTVQAAGLTVTKE